VSDRNIEPAVPVTPAPSSSAPLRKEKGAAWWDELKGVFWLILAVLAFHSLIAKPFYIPSESMMPTLIKGDRLVVSKFPYGWSFVSPSFHVMPETKGRLFGSLPKRGDIVIVVPRGVRADYIKRVIGLPGDRIAMQNGQIILNGTPVPKVALPNAEIPVDPNVPCDQGLQEGRRVTGADGKLYCSLPIFRETLPNGVSYNTIDLAYLPEVDDMPTVIVPPDHVFLMGDNRDQSADSRVPAIQNGLDGPVPWENIGGRAEVITFSLDGSTTLLNPLSWFSALRGGRAGTSLRPAQDAGPVAKP
jgi:signal peptidase I